MKNKKLALLSACAVLTSPLWIPFSFLGYVGYRWGTTTTRFAFKHPNATVAGITLAGLLGYVSCYHTTDMKNVTGSAISWAAQQAYQPKVDELEEHVKTTTSENELLQERTTLHETHISTLEQTLETYEERTKQYQESNEELRETLKNFQRSSGEETISQPGYNIYYTKPGDTLSNIAKKVSGDTSKYHIIAEDNRISNPNMLLAGQFLWLRKTICTQYSADVYSKAPRLKSTLVPWNVSIHDTFPTTWQSVLEVNKKLGLNYSDSDPTKKGSRVVYHPEK